MVMLSLVSCSVSLFSPPISLRLHLPPVTALSSHGSFPVSTCPTELQPLLVSGLNRRETGLVFRCNCLSSPINVASQMEIGFNEEETEMVLTKNPDVKSTSLDKISARLALLVETQKHTDYRGRKQEPTMNVLAICNFDMKFIYQAKYEAPFPHPPIGKYYLVDSGYPTRHQDRVYWSTSKG
ncbi:unnamed protein product [Microthlaspi erraticum]|uniref:DDE Tnp4 domain-containing protein n=1 Tax=Microthlaspi erraticum TaxID=1685480 RepID=A0A6D2KNK5_9BRAS|nr:unnamed protein product [Microthlaspi erraticum]